MITRPRIWIVWDPQGDPRMQRTTARGPQISRPREHSRGDTRYRDALRALVAYCGEVAALESPSLEAAE